jgi:hypothetical protein
MKGLAPTARYVVYYFLIFASFVASTNIKPKATEEYRSDYVFTAFTQASESNLYVYTSKDAAKFTLLKGPAYVSLPSQL